MKTSPNISNTQLNIFLSRPAREPGRRPNTWAPTALGTNNDEQHESEPALRNRLLVCTHRDQPSGAGGAEQARILLLSTRSRPWPV